jgi:hypothetical protein
VGTLVTAVAALEDSKVVAVPTWVMVEAVAVVAAGNSFGTAPVPAATTMMPSDTPMMLHQKPESDGWPRRARLLPCRGPVPSVLVNLFELLGVTGRRSADISISSGAWKSHLHNKPVTNLARRRQRRTNFE